MLHATIETIDPHNALVVFPQRVCGCAHTTKSLDPDGNFKPKHTLFCRELRFVAIYALFFGDLWAKKCLFG